MISLDNTGIEVFLSSIASLLDCWRFIFFGADLYIAWIVNGHDWGRSYCLLDIWI